MHMSSKSVVRASDGFVLDQVIAFADAVFLNVVQDLDHVIKLCQGRSDSFAQIVPGQLDVLPFWLDA